MCAHTHVYRRKVYGTGELYFLILQQTVAQASDKTVCGAVEHFCDIWPCQVLSNKAQHISSETDSLTVDLFILQSHSGFKFEGVNLLPFLPIHGTLT